MLDYDKCKEGDRVFWDSTAPNVYPDSDVYVIIKKDNSGKYIRICKEEAVENGSDDDIENHTYTFYGDVIWKLYKEGDETNTYLNFVKKHFRVGQVFKKKKGPGYVYKIKEVKAGFKTVVCDYWWGPDASKASVSTPVLVEGIVDEFRDWLFLSPEYSKNKYITINKHPATNQVTLKYKKGNISASVLVQDTPEGREQGYAELSQKVTAIKFKAKSTIPGTPEANIARLTRSEPNGIVQLWERKIATQIKKCEEGKKPLTLERHIGVEIEFLTKSLRKDIAKSFIKEKLDGYTQLKHDGSVKDNSDQYERCAYCQNDETCYREDCTPDHCFCECLCGPEAESDVLGHEIAIVAPEVRINDILERVCGVLKQQHKAYVNKTCGLHIHLDARSNDHATMFHNLVACQNLLFSLVPRSRRSNRFCLKNDRGSELLKYAGTERYWAINPHSYGRHRTIEVRLHSGTLNADKIANWISILKAIAYTDKIASFNGLDDLDKLKLPDEVNKYIYSRIKKVKGEAQIVPTKPARVNTQERPEGVLPVYDPLGLVNTGTR